MEYEDRKPVTRNRRGARRHQQHKTQRKAEEKHRQSSATTGKPDRFGNTQGQNAEQGNTTESQNTVPLATPGEKRI